MTIDPTQLAADRSQETPKPDAQNCRQFPVLGSRGATVDYQMVVDHGEQAQKNHYQSVKCLAQRGGLSWSELYAVLHNKRWEKIDTNDAIIACRALEAKYLAPWANTATLTARVAELEGALEAAGKLRDAADNVSQWFCVEARDLEGPRIQALRACMVAYDTHMQPSNTALEAKP